jgi:hypothetical protein
MAGASPRWRGLLLLASATQEVDARFGVTLRFNLIAALA